jgi:hypothetical protein
MNCTSYSYQYTKSLFIPSKRMYTCRQGGRHVLYVPTCTSLVPPALYRGYLQGETDIARARTRGNRSSGFSTQGWPWHLGCNQTPFTEILQRGGYHSSNIVALLLANIAWFVSYRHANIPAYTRNFNII